MGGQQFNLIEANPNFRSQSISTFLRVISRSSTLSYWRPYSSKAIFNFRKQEEKSYPIASSSPQLASSIHGNTNLHNVSEASPGTRATDTNRGRNSSAGSGHRSSPAPKEPSCSGGLEQVDQVRAFRHQSAVPASRSGSLRQARKPAESYASHSAGTCSVCPALGQAGAQSEEAQDRNPGCCGKMSSIASMISELDCAIAACAGQNIDGSRTDESAALIELKHELQI